MNDQQPTPDLAVAMVEAWFLAEAGLLALAAGLGFIVRFHGLLHGSLLIFFRYWKSLILVGEWGGNSRQIVPYRDISDPEPSRFPY